MKYKRTIICVIIMAIFVNMWLVPINTYASKTSENVSFSSMYLGQSSDGTLDVYFSISSVSENTFNGHLTIKDSNSLLNVDTDISGDITFLEDHYRCYAEFKTSWLFVKYNSNITVDVYPMEGKAYCTGGGEGWMFQVDNLELNGTKNSFYNKQLSYNENDMKLCMALSNAMYVEKNKQNELQVEETLDDTINSFYDDIIHSEPSVYNYRDEETRDIENNPDNVAFAIMKRDNGNKLDIIVSIRGTYYDEWIGNTELTGKAYDSNQYVHDNFRKAELSITDKIKEYYSRYQDKYDKINLIITGHSRGAAVANLYAKDAIDVMNGTFSSSDNIKEENFPIFDNVTAYTFACPNVEKVKDSKLALNMENNYTSIYNFWFDTDIVPTVAPTLTSDGWNYWKYGRCYTMDVSDYYDSGIKLLGHNIDLGGLNQKAKYELAEAFSQWPDIESYYKKNLMFFKYDKAENANVAEYISLFDFLNTATYLKSTTFTNRSFAVAAMKDFIKCPSLKPLLSFAVKNIGTINISHNNQTYNHVINNFNSENDNTYLGFGDDYFSRYTFYDAKYMTSNSVEEETASTVDLLESDSAENNYNSDEAEALKQLALIDGNAERLGWDLSDLSTWSGVIWNDEGHVISLDFTYKWLTGSFDFSVFSQLQNLNLYANSLKEIKLNNDSLTMLNCSFNDLSENSLDLSNCGNLTELYCDGCSLSTLDVRTVPKLEVLSCSFNNLISLNIENNSKLNHISCPYNYLDMHEGGVISTLLNKYKTENNAYVNSKPQLLPSDAVTDSDELMALETFAKIGDNNSSLDWLDNNGDISIDKLQNNAYFDYDGEKYRISAIDISDMNVEGKLDLSAFSELSAVYCENTGVSSLVLTNCTKVEAIDCRCSKISELILPSNIKNDTSRLNEIDCEYNYVDTKIFTNDIINHIKSNEYYILNYINQRGDSSALQAAVSYGESLEEADYSKNSFAQLNEILCKCKKYNYDNLYLTQADIDSLTADILTKIYNLKAFLNAKISAKNGIVKVFYDETELEDNSLSNSGGVIELPPDTEGFTVSDESDTFSVLFGTTVTLTATPKEGYNFVGWFDLSSNRHISTENPYTFRVAANVDVKAIFASDGDATLTFLTPSNQVITTISKFPAEWAEINTINGLVPDVPFKYGCKNGRWEYNEADVLLKLRSGENVNIVSAYDKGEFTVPSARNAEGKPALDLYYKYDDESGIGSFIMTTCFPENIRVESVGIAYYFKAADSFNPKDYILTLNNKVRTSKFGMDKLYDYYIMNMKNINDRNNWSVRGYVAYYDSDNNLQVEYSNQINIINNIVDRSTVSNDNSATQLPPDEV